MTSLAQGNADLVVHNADFVITVDKDRRIIQNGSVVIKGNSISRVVKANEVTQEELAGRVIDASGKIASPGFIDTHIHTTKQFNRGLADDVELRDHLLARNFPFEAALDEEDAYWSSIACTTEMIRSGTTCFIDAGNQFPDCSARAIEETGIRGIIARTASDLGGSVQGHLPAQLVTDSTEEMLTLSTQTVERWNGKADGRIRAWFQVRITYLGSDTLCQEMKRLADQHKTGMESHCSSSLENRSTAYRTFGMTELRRLDKLGVLGPNFMGIHMGWVEEGDMYLLPKYDVKIAHCPASSMHAAMGCDLNGKIPMMMAMGVTVGLGSDAAPSNNSLDMIRNMYCAGIHKEIHQDARLLPAEKALEMGTIDGARVAQWDDEIGSLEAGKKADLVLINANQVEMQPMYNPVSNLVYSCHAGHVDTTIVDGKVLMEGRRVLTVNEDKLLEETRRRGDQITTRAGLDHVRHSSWPLV